MVWMKLHSLTSATMHQSLAACSAAKSSLASVETLATTSASGSPDPTAALTSSGFSFFSASQPAGVTRVIADRMGRRPRSETSSGSLSSAQLSLGSSMRGKLSSLSPLWSISC